MKRNFLIIFFLVVTFNFFLPRLLPGEPFIEDTSGLSLIASNYTEAQIKHYKEYYNMDASLPVQYSTYLKRLVTFDLGYSIHQQLPVIDVLKTRLPWTIAIASSALVISAMFGIFLGVFSSFKRESKLDSIIYSFMISIGELPAFLIGLLLLMVFSVGLGWFPLAGGSTLFTEFAHPFEAFKDWLSYAILPIFALILFKVSDFYLITRSSVMMVITKDYMRTAKAKNVGWLRTATHYALKNAAPPIISRFLMSFGLLLGATVFIEQVFRYPGIGQLMITAITVRDYVLVQGIFLCMTLIILCCSFLADFFYRVLDPRLKELK